MTLRDSLRQMAGITMCMVHLHFTGTQYFIDAAFMCLMTFCGHKGWCDNRSFYIKHQKASPPLARGGEKKDTGGRTLTKTSARMFS